MRFKDKILLLFLILLSMVFIPLLSTMNISSTSNLKAYNQNFLPQILSPKEDFFCVLDESTNETVKIPDRDFLYGAVTCEMPALFEEEALKAQAVACYTYFCRERKKAREFKKEYDITMNSKKGLTYATQEQMKLKWGNNFETYYQKIKNCVDQVFPEVIKDDKDLILAAYHAISSGETESSKDVFGGELKYLTNVESPGDKLTPGYETKVEVSAENFKEKILNNYDNITFQDDPSQWIKNPIRTQSGMIKQIEICSANIAGTEIRKIFSLRSSNFDVNYNPEERNFIFTVRGYGHGVGMSQTGAQYMAKQGANYKQILSWYYPTTSISKLKSA